MTTISYDSDCLDDPETIQNLRGNNEHFNSKTSVVEQLQKLLCSLGARLNYKLMCNTEVHNQVNKHRYVVINDNKPVMEVSFCAHGPLSKISSAVKEPQSINQFNQFLDKLGTQLPAPINGVLTDMLRIMTVCNESAFAIDSFLDETESILVLEGNKLRQRFEFVIHHA